MWILNSFSLNLLACLNAVIKSEEVTLAKAQDVPCAGRITVTLHKGDTVMIGQYSGPRLEEGATTLPPGATIKWCRVTILA